MLSPDRHLWRVRVVVLAIVAALFVVEVGLRVAGVTPRIAAIGDDAFGYRLLPNQVHDDGHGLRRVNADGFYADEDFAPPVPKAERSVLEGGRRGLRVVVFDSSHGVGPGVAPSEAWPRVLERTLRTTDPETLVMNLSVSGYGVEQHARLYHAFARAYEPDVVVLGLSDLSAVPLVVRGTPRSWLRPLLRRSVLFDLWTRWITNDRADGFPPARDAKEAERRAQFAAYMAAPLAPTSNAAWDEARTHVASIAEAQREHGGRLLLLCGPLLHHGDEAARRPAERARAWAIAPVLDPRARWAGPDGALPPSLFLTADPSHWSAPGHASIAAEVADATR